MAPRPASRGLRLAVRESSLVGIKLLSWHVPSTSDIQSLCDSGEHRPRSDDPKYTQARRRNRFPGDDPGLTVRGLVSA